MTVQTVDIDEATATRLRDDADLLYLMRDVDDVYRRSSAGGSKIIRGHQRRVRETLVRVIERDPVLRQTGGAVKPVTAHLPRALELGAHGPLSRLARTVGRVCPRLDWVYGYEKMPTNLAKRFAYAEIVGPNGPVPAETIVVGLVLFAPGTVYPQHAHADIEESYVSVAGAWSENDAAVYAPGSLILNRSHDKHRITVGDRDPCLLVYAWLGTEDRLRAPGMVFSRQKRGTPRGN
jgi:dimethylpropiothetin dethiomethylase